MIREQHVKRRYYERFQVEDVINFFSGQLLQAKSSDGAQVFLQSIKINRRPLPAGYQEALKKLQHPHLAPILDILEEEDQLILVHPPFSGDPLPLLVNRERAMEPEYAIQIADMLFKTLTDLDRLPLKMGAALDPKNILLNGDNPVLLFYYIKDEQTSALDDKWRELLYYLLTGQAPSDSLKQCEKQLEAKQVPPKFKKLALQCLDSKVSFDEVRRAIADMSAANRQAHAGFRSDAKQRKRRRIYTTVSVFAAFLVLVAIAVSQWKPLDSSASGDPFGFFRPQEEEKKDKFSSDELIQSVSFSNEKRSYTLPYILQGASTVRGEIMLEKLNGFIGLLETKDKQSAYGLEIDNQGRLTLFQKAGNRKFEFGNSGTVYRIKPGKKYTFELHYFPGEPLRISINEQGQVEKWMAVGTSPIHSELFFRFYGREGATLFYPQLNAISDRKAVEDAWMNGQPWQLDFGQGILTVDDQQKNRLKVTPRTQVRVALTASASLTLIPPADGDRLHMDLQAIDGSRYRLVWKKSNRLFLYRFKDSLEKVKEQEIDWSLKDNEPVQVSVTSVFNELQIKLTHGSKTAEIKYVSDEPISLRDVTLRNPKGFELLQENQQEKGRN
ncbi:hypothetical protein [Lihuaxuella thermophila]|uniref:hypothetical protein n=1 Tax=Lihuaxuella thermophila TaxID=1173111 RepID=UPI000B7CEBFA|nr:hypothetical protein [Lihuaxuella thermophila]